MQCLGRTRSFIRCKNEGETLFCHKHNYQKYIILSFCLFTLIPTIIGYSGIYNLIWGDRYATQKDVLSLREELKKEFELFTIPESNSETTYAGFGVAIGVKLYKQNEIRRKYIFDVAEIENKNRVSFFLDAKDRLVFELVDKFGERFSTRVSQDKIEFNKPIFFFVEYGMSNKFSFIRIFKDNILLSQEKYEFGIDPPENFEKGLTIFADVFGKNNIHMTSLYYAIFNSTLSKTERDKFYYAVRKFIDAIGRNK